MKTLLRSRHAWRHNVSKAEKALPMQLITYKVITCGQHGMISGQQAGSLDSASGSHGQCPTNLVGQAPKAPMSPLGRTNSDFEEIQVALSTSTAPVALPAASGLSHTLQVSAPNMCRQGAAHVQAALLMSTIQPPICNLPILWL